MKIIITVLFCCVLVNGYIVEPKNKSAPPTLAEQENRTEDEDDKGSFLDKFNNCEEDDDLTKNTTMACHGLKLARRAMIQLMDQGLEVVDAVNGSRSYVGENANVYEKAQNFLKNHQLKFKLQDVLPDSEEVGRAIRGGLQQIEEGRGKAKKQLGSLIAAALMMKGMLAAIGFKGLALLTLKALGVATLALTLAGLLALKSLSSKGHSGHVTVIPVGGHHDRNDEWRRVSQLENSPYRGYEVYEKPELTH